MGKKTGKKLQILIHLEDDPELQKEFEALKHELKIKSGVDLVGFLIHDKYKQLEKEK